MTTDTTDTTEATNEVSLFRERLVRELSSLGLDPDQVQLAAFLRDHVFHLDVTSPHSHVGGGAAVGVIPRRLGPVGVCTSCLPADPALRLLGPGTTHTLLSTLRAVSQRLEDVVSGEPRDLRELHKTLKELGDARSMTTQLAAGRWPGTDLVGLVAARLRTDLVEWLHRQLVERELAALSSHARALRATRQDVAADVADAARSSLLEATRAPRWYLVDTVDVLSVDLEEHDPEVASALNAIRRGPGTKGFVIVATDAMVRHLTVDGAILMSQLAELAERPDARLLEAVDALYRPGEDGACSTLADAVAVATALDR